MKAWEEIINQYNDAIGGHESTHRIGLYKKVVDYDHKIKIVENFVLVLFDYHVQKFCDIVNETLSTKFKFDVNKPEEYEKDLNSCLLRLGGWKIRLKLEEAAMMSKHKKNSEDGAVKPSSEYFSNILINLSDNAGYEITEEITVYKFCERIKRYIQHCDKMKQNTNKKRLQTF